MDSGVHYVAAIWPSDDRVEVEFGHLRQVIGEPGHAEQQVLQRAQISGRSTPVPEQQRSRVNGTAG
jgi:hypothetical protein